MLYVLKGTPLQTVVQKLLEIVEKAGIRPRVLLLDRGFYQAPVVRFLQASRVPFLMPMIMRGRKPSHPKGPSGTYVFTAQKKGGPTSYTWKGKDGKDCTVKVYRVRTRDVSAQQNRC